MGLQLIVSMPPDREGFVVEIWENDKHFGEVFSAAGVPIVEIYSHPDGKPWKIAFSEVTEALQEAMRRLNEK